MNTPITRRDFVRLGAGAVAAGAVVKTTLLEPATLPAQSHRPRRPQDPLCLHRHRNPRLRSAAIRAPGADGECVGTADLYTMHQKAGQEAYGADIPDTRAIIVRCWIARTSMP